MLNSDFCTQTGTHTTEGTQFSTERSMTYVRQSDSFDSTATKKNIDPHALTSHLLTESGLPRERWSQEGTEAIANLIAGGLLSDETILMVAQTLFSMSQLASPDSLPHSVSLQSILTAIMGNSHYMEVIEKTKALSKIELAAIHLDDSLVREEPERTEELRQEALSQSFRRVVSAEPYSAVKDSTNLWRKYFLSSVRLCHDVPASLIKHAVKSVASRRIVTSSLANYGRGYRRWDWLSRDQRERLVTFSTKVLVSISHKDPTDYLALWELSRILTTAGRYEEAMSYYTQTKRSFELAGHPGHDKYCHILMSEVTALEKECKDRKRSQGRSRTARLCRDIHGKYRDLISYAKYHGVPCDPYLQAYVRFQVSMCNFRGALKTADEMSDGYRKYLELGMLHSSNMLLGHLDCAELLDYEKATDYFRLAWNALSEEGEDLTRSRKMSVLVPLASALANGKSYRDSYAVCKYALTIKNEPKIIEILQDLKDQMTIVPEKGNGSIEPRILAAS